MVASLNCGLGDAGIKTNMDTLTKNENENELTLTNADAYQLQDAWHYATLITDRGNSTFDGDREFPVGIRGQMVAYEYLLDKIDDMTANNETWQLIQHNWCYPTSFGFVRINAHKALIAINAAAKRLGIDARTACKPE